MAAVEGRSVVYRRTGANGGVGRTGWFSFGTNGSTDVACFRYAIDADPPVGTGCDASSGVVRTGTALAYAPDHVGRVELHVQAVDEARNVSPIRVYTFEVASAQMVSKWYLDDQQSGTDEYPKTSARPAVGKKWLTLDDGVTWTDGPMGTGMYDWALQFSRGSSAHATGPVVATRASFSVGAHVRVDDVSAAGTAVSQDGANAPGFELGIRTDGCPGGLAACWAFSRKTADTAGASVVVAASSVPVSAGHWYYVLGQYEKSNGTMRVWVCQADYGLAPDPQGSKVVDVSRTYTPWAATGAFRVGAAWGGGKATRGWRGAVAGVRTSDGLLDTSQITADCADRVSF